MRVTESVILESKYGFIGLLKRRRKNIFIYFLASFLEHTSHHSKFNHSIKPFQRRHSLALLIAMGSAPVTRCEVGRVGGASRAPRSSVICEV